MRSLRFFGLPVKSVALFLVTLALCLAAYTWLMARFGYGTPPQASPPAQQADRIVVHKASRTLELRRNHQIIARYRISLGSAADKGPKAREGDQKTPEGRYAIDWRNARSKYHLSLHISYPDAHDRQTARAGGYRPGSNIMIHGLPNGWGWLAPVFQRMDWTDGCIAVSNEEMREIWSRVPEETLIEIMP